MTEQTSTTPTRHLPASGPPAPPDPTAERVPLRVLVPLSIQHLLVMVSGPISSAFLLSSALKLSPQAGAGLLASLFLVSGVGTALQSAGPFGIGARLPFVMLPGGAAVALFIQIAQASGPATATGAVLVTAVLVLLAAPLFGRLTRLFPPVVLGAMIVVIGVNLMRITAGLLVDTPRGPSGTSLTLAGVTVLAIVLAHRLLPGPIRRVAVLAGILIGAVVAALWGRLGVVAAGPVVAVPTPLPFGTPVFDLLAALPLVLFSIGAMAEAAGQTTLTADAVGRPTGRHDIARTIRGDAVTSLAAGLFGGPLMVTSGENIGIIRLSGVRSRYVTLGTAVLLVVLAFLSPVGRWIAAVPPAVVGGAGLVVFAMVTMLGVRLLQQADLEADGVLLTATVALVAGLLPVIAPTVYQALPTAARLVLGSGVTMAALVGAAASLLLTGPASRATRTGSRPV